MVELKELAIPIVVAVVSAIVTVLVTALVSIKIRYASSEAEAVSGLRILGTNVIYYCWVAWLLYGLIRQAISSDPVTREVVVSIALYTSSLAVVLVVRLLRKILKLLEMMVNVEKRHWDITERIISSPEAEQDTSSKPNSASAVKRAAD